MEDNFLKVAKQAAIEAGKVIRKCSGEDLDLSLKNEDKSNFVTKADLEAEETIVKILTKNFPTHNIIAEENTKIDKGSKYTWVVDPIDGTITFVHGIPYFSVSIGLLENNKPILGAIYIIGKHTKCFRCSSLYFGFWAQKEKTREDGGIYQSPH